MARKTADLVEMNLGELIDELRETKHEALNLRFRNATGQLDNTAEIRRVRRQIEAARIAMTRAIKRGGKVWINVFPDKPVTKKPAETRMGSGKGNPEFWVAVVKPGRVLFELSFPDEQTARAALNKAIQKLPIKARIITREEVY